MDQSTQTTPKTPRVAFIQARWHSDIVDQSRISFISEMERLTNTDAQVDVIDVPGAFEIPLQARTLARTGKYDAIVGAAFVVDGGIYRHDFVASTVLDGMMRAQMDTDVPVLSVVLTPHQFQETDEHRRFFLDHLAIKGAEAARSCVAIVNQRAQDAA
jgi:6,7-dimethyl-8-ribityllumazine synthase